MTHDMTIIIDRDFKAARNSKGICIVFTSYCNWNPMRREIDNIDAGELRKIHLQTQVYSVTIQNKQRERDQQEPKFSAFLLQTLFYSTVRKLIFKSHFALYSLWSDTRLSVTTKVSPVSKSEQGLSNIN